MSQLDLGEVSIHYEEFGEGYPLLLLAPGGFNSTIEFWARAAINRLTGSSGAAPSSPKAALGLASRRRRAAR